MLLEQPSITAEQVAELSDKNGISKLEALDRLKRQRFEDQKADCLRNLEITSPFSPFRVFKILKWLVEHTKY